MIGPKPDKKTPVEFTGPRKKALMARAKGVCEGCGKPMRTELHHRLYRGRGGRGDVVNGLNLCGFGNHASEGCHGIAHTGEGQALGWSVRSGYDPAEVPALVFVDGRQQWVRFLPDGDRVPVPEADAIEYLELIHARKVA